LAYYTEDLTCRGVCEKAIETTKHGTPTNGYAV
jgi:hypothetical protein